MPPLIIDIATAPLEDVDTYLEPPMADKRLKDPAKIEADLAEKITEARERAALDLDLLRITAIGVAHTDRIGLDVWLCCTMEDERAALQRLAVALKDDYGGLVPLVTWNGHGYDLPALMRRAKWLREPFPILSTDRYKSINRDLMLEMSDRDPKRYRSLNFYIRRQGWTDLIEKPLSGADEAKVHQTGQWAELDVSVRRDVEALRRLAVWWGIR